MNGREALKALAEGKQVRAEVARTSCGARAYVDAAHQTVSEVLSRDGWELVQEPATDEELAAEMEQLGCMFAPESAATEVAQRCARLLRTRKVGL